MAIVRVHNKARNITYVYESESYWDKELKQPRSHRKLIGRIDPATGDVVPTSRKARDEEPSTPSTYSDTDYQNCMNRLFLQSIRKTPSYVNSAAALLLWKMTTEHAIV